MTTESHLWRVVQAWLNELPFPPSQRQLAKALGVSPQTITNWRTGDTRPRPDNVRAIAEMMRLHVGPDAYDKLIYAVNQDQGYYP